MSSPSKPIILITCTYERSGRIKYIQRCARTFRKIKNVLWIVVEDNDHLDDKVSALLKQSGINHVYLKDGPTRDKGNAQKNLALSYVRDQKLDAIVYIADDDNFYDIKLFDEIRKTIRVSIFPVGNLGPRGIERPVIKNGKIVGWDAEWLERKFPVDMAGFAFDANILNMLSEPPWHYQSPVAGETDFLEKFIKTQDELELLCGDCTKCYVWHNEPLAHLLPTSWKEKLLPGINRARYIKRRLMLYRDLPFYFSKLRKETFLRNSEALPQRSNSNKYLYAVPAQSAQKSLLSKIIERFGHKNFDFVLFVWDGSQFNEPIFDKCKIIYEKGLKWAFMKKYLTPDLCKPYDYIFTWDDDIDICDFSYENFIRIMEKNRMEMAQPALAKGSYSWHPVTRQKKGAVGCYTDFVEIMVPVFEREAWTKFWQILEPKWNGWAWGCDELARDLCGYKNMGVVHCEAVKHIKPLGVPADAIAGRTEFYKKYPKAEKSRHISYADLR